MKQITKYKKAVGLLTLAAGMLASCKKLVEIPANPPTSITQSEQFTDSASAMSAVAAIYTYNPGDGFGYSDAYLTICTGLSSDELSFTGSSDRQQFYSYTLTPLNSSISVLWAEPYQSLYQVNAVIASLTNNTRLSAAFIRQITAEMKVVRALYYFNMVNIFGGVPLVTSTDYTATAHIPQATVAAVYAQIMTDLSDAVANLPAANPSGARYRPNLYAAQALLAKVNLYQGQWQAAYNEADSIIKSAAYSLEPDLNSVFLDGSNEAIWQLPAQQLYYETQEAVNFIPEYDGAIPNYLVTPYLHGAFEPGDQRLQNWIASTIIPRGATNDTFYYPNKYKNVLASSPTVEDYMISRLGEVLLIRAEAAAHLNNLNQALADVNTIRQRAGLLPTLVNATSQDSVLNAIMHERQTELFCEWGNRWFDLKRTGAAGIVLDAEKTGWQANAALYPLPQAQIQLDNLLKQNPGY